MRLIDEAREMDFALLNNGGNAGFQRKMVKLIQSMETSETIGQRLDLVIRFIRNIRVLEKSKMYSDIGDTMVRETVLYFLEKVLAYYGIRYELSYWM